MLQSNTLAEKLSKSAYLYLAAVLDALLLAEPDVGRALAGQREELDGRHLGRGGGGKGEEDGDWSELHRCCDCYTLPGATALFLRLPCP